MAKAPKAEKAGKAKIMAEGTLNPELQQLIERLPLWKRPGYLIRRLHQVHYALFFEECHEFGITPVQYGLLTILSGNPDSDQISLAQALGIDRTNVADVLTRLAQRGLVDRTRSTEDKRMVLARLTAEGEKLVAAMHPAMSRAQERLIETLGDDEREAFLATLLKLLEANNKYGRAALATSKFSD
ncbi:MarR family winged helix-turn-helix transcriptional regulator [Aminobacter sp. UC22_36]|uniref:MarR family winged helix-turn-helix transcriptional regulator n=1 Tax=Aminobacter sp. UC22_36 TaxID=3374549 RepID=UPI003757E5E0